jgi:manganese/zinc/iron transport system ATP- binding protein
VNQVSDSHSHQHSHGHEQYPNGNCQHAEPRWPYGGRGHRDPLPGSLAVVIVGLQVCYPGSNTAVLTDISLRVPCGERVALIGHNGAGKSTLLKTLAGLLEPQAGMVRLFGNPVGACHHRTAYLPQRTDLDWQFPISVQQLVITGRYVHLGWFQKPRNTDYERVNVALQRLGIRQLAQKQISQLSGGQQQRALLARALVQESSLFLLDEPLNAVDEATREVVDDVLHEHTQQGGTVLVATHDLGRLSESFDQAIYLREGRIDRIGYLAGGSDMKASTRYSPC